MVKVVEQVVPRKRRRFNKNKKKAWRKKTNIDDVEENLEEERREERYGGPLEERCDKELLFLDVGEADPKVELKDDDFTFEYTVDKIPEDSCSAKKATKVALKPSSKKHQVKTLKAHQFINGLQGVKPPHKPRLKKDGLSVKMKKKAQLEAKDPKLAKKAVQKLKEIAAANKKRSNRPRTVIRTKFEDDLWTTGADDVTQECNKKGLEDSFIKDIAKHYGIMRKLRPVNVPKCKYVKPSKLKAVRPPHSGASYNPSFTDHQELLQKAISQEESRMRKTERVECLTTQMFPTIDEAPTEETWLQEMSQGLPKAGDEDNEIKEEEEEEEEEEQVDNEQLTVTHKPRNERKTKKQRRKELKEKIAKLKRLGKKEERVRESCVFRVKTYQKEIDEFLELLKTRKHCRIGRHKQRQFMPRCLGRLRFHEEDVVVNLGNELPGSLREVVPAVSLLEERFKNLQRRNMIEPRLPHKMVRKYKLKKTVKRNYKLEFDKIEKMVDSLLE
ncbi:hypothetical protein OTU49_001184 [Cherax quadricarinatus]|uniref:Ribosome biogenesis protein NOP53 n=1 Tax=Cherax quadricarinatus TaxID=27406 RepID=A0AAW0XIH8_CHEQU